MLDFALRRIDSDCLPISALLAADVAGFIPSDWLICQTPRREAEGLIAGKTAVELATAKNKPDDVKEGQAKLAEYRVQKPDGQKAVPSTEPSVPSKAKPKN